MNQPALLEMGVGWVDCRNGLEWADLLGMNTNDEPRIGIGCMKNQCFSYYQVALVIVPVEQPV